MKRRTTAFLVVCGIAVAAPSMNADYVVASPVDDQRREVERIVDELAKLDEQADILAEDYVVAVDEKNQLDDEVAAARARIAAKEAELDALRGDLSEVAVRAFTGAGGDVLGPLFSNAAAYSDTLQRDQLSRVALSVGTATTDDLDALIADLEAERADLADKLEAAEALTETIAEAQAATVELTAEYQAQRAAAEAKYQAAIVEEEARRAEESARQFARDAAAAAGQAPRPRPPSPAPPAAGVAEAETVIPAAVTRQRWRLAAVAVPMRRPPPGSGNDRPAARPPNRSTTPHRRRSRTPRSPPPNPSWASPTSPIRRFRVSVSTAQVSRRTRGGRPACTCRTSPAPRRRWCRTSRPAPPNRAT